MRIPRIAGTWYPNSPDEIAKIVGCGKASSLRLAHPAAIVVPHAGYAYSGRIAANAFARIKPDEYDKIIIIAPSHHAYMRRSFSVEPAEDVSTPFGTIKFSRELHDRLAALPFSRFLPEAHPVEHAIDIELPLVRRFLPGCSVGAMIVGDWDCRSPEDPRLLSEFATAFRKLLDSRTLVVISSDFTHYGSDFGYVPFTVGVSSKLPALDAEMFAELSKNDNVAWSEALHRTGATICGAPCFHLFLAALPKSARFERLEYATSADVTGDWSHVVGYTTAAVYADWTQPLKSLAAAKDDVTALSEKAGRALLQVAEFAIRKKLLGAGRADAPEISGEIRRELSRKCGAFVTLTINGMLRGCIGLIESDQPVLDVVREMAVEAAVGDPRFTPVIPEELPFIKIEVSVLSEPADVPGPDGIVIGRDGVILSKHRRRAVFLPQVAPEQGWDVPTMLTQLSLKAGLAPDAWKSGAAFKTFRAQVFH